MLLPLLHHHHSQVENAAGASDLISRYQAQDQVAREPVESAEIGIEQRMLRRFEDDEILLLLVAQAVVTGAIH